MAPLYVHEMVVPTLDINMVSVVQLQHMGWTLTIEPCEGGVMSVVCLEGRDPAWTRLIAGSIMNNFFPVFPVFPPPPPPAAAAPAFPLHAPAFSVPDVPAFVPAPGVLAGAGLGRVGPAKKRRRPVDMRMGVFMDVFMDMDIMDVE